MKFSKKATSISEALVVMLIIVSWTVWMYQIYMESMKLSDSTKNKIQAIWIAREWIEAFSNIRDTNWLLFWSDYQNCWNTLNYNTLCIWNSDISYDILQGSYIIFKDNDNRWKLNNTITWDFSTVNYKEKNKVWYDSDWFYTQSWTLITSQIVPFFTREIKIEYIEDTNWLNSINSNDEKLKVTSLVYWVDRSSTKPHKVELSTILSNYKNK